MNTTKALFDCTFSWGKTCRLYRDSIEIAGKSYNLDDLTYIQPTYRHLFGVPSARLELCFGLRRLTLRGIPDLEIVRQMVSHLLPYVEQAGPNPLSHRARLRASQARDLARAQARAWERTNKIPALLDEAQPGAPATPAATPVPEASEAASVAQPVPPSESAHDFDDVLDFSESPTSYIPKGLLSGKLTLQQSEGTSAPPAAPFKVLSLPARFPTPMPLDGLPSEPAAQPSAVSLPAPAEPAAQPPTDPLPQPEQPATQLSIDPPQSPRLAANEPPVESQERLLHSAKTRPAHIPRLQPPLRSVQLVNPELKTLESCSVPVPALKANVLPIIPVPVRLQPGECAHYSIGAALCSDRLAGSERAPYPPLDHGLLILTNRRILYLGKRSQLILAYTHLWYVSLLHNAIALHIEKQFRRIIMEVEHPQEWAGRIEQLAFVARRLRPRSEQTFVLPGFKASSTLPVTLKRPALKLPESKEKATPEAASSPDENIDQRIVEARTTDLEQQHGTHLAEVKTLEFELQTEPPPAEVKASVFKSNADRQIAETDTIELEIHTEPSIVEPDTLELEVRTEPSIAESHTLELDQPSMHSFEDVVTSSHLALATYEEEVTSKLTALIVHKQDGQEEVETHLLSLDEEEVTSKLTAISAPDKPGLEEGKTSVLALSKDNQENEDEQTMPLRRKKIAAIATHPLRPKVGQYREARMQHVPQIRVLSRTRFLKAEG